MNCKLKINTIFTALIAASAIIATFHVSNVFASTIIPTTTGGTGLSSAISGVGNKISGYGSDTMYVLYGTAGLSAVLAFLEYMFMREHKKTIYTTLGIGLASGVGGVIAQAVSHGQVSGTGATGAMITGAIHHAAIYTSAHLHNLRKK
jgi:hypothetical protein